jgi:hypothetical protein
MVSNSCVFVAFVDRKVREVEEVREVAAGSVEEVREVAGTRVEAVGSVVAGTRVAVVEAGTEAVSHLLPFPSSSNGLSIMQEV